MTSYLQKPFFEWFKEKTEFYMEFFEEPLNGVNENLFKDLGFTKEEFIQKFIKPYENLTSEQIKEIAKLQSKLSKNILQKEFIFEVSDKKLYRNFNAALWTLFQVSELSLFDFSNLPLLEPEYETFMQEFLEYSTPCMQCYYCGKPFEDEYGNEFNDKTSYCFHAPRAKGVTLNEGTSCTSEWRNFSQGLRRDIERVEKKKLRKYENYTKEDQQEEITKFFMKFCKKLYEHNLTNKYTIQTLYKRVTPDGYKYKLEEAKLVKDFEI